MSIDYYTCTICHEIFPDCGKFFSCDCGYNYCSDECGDRGDNWDAGEKDCQICRKEYVLDGTLIQFLLKKLSLTRDEATELYFEEAQSA